jgi:hypothetical protein
LYGDQSIEKKAAGKKASVKKQRITNVVSGEMVVDCEGIDVNTLERVVQKG